MRIHSLHEALTEFPDIDGLWQSKDLGATEAGIRARLPGDWQQVNSAAEVELLTQLARALALQGKATEAQDVLDLSSQLISKNSIGLESPTQLRWLLEQGRLFSLKMVPTRAHDFFVKAWELASKTEQRFFAIDAALMLSTIRPPRGQNEWLKRALSMAEESSSDTRVRLWLAPLLFLDGWHSFDNRQFEKALESFDRVLTEIAVDQNHDHTHDHIPINQKGLNESKKFSSLWSRARTLRALGRTTEALEIQESLLNKMTVTGKVSGHVYLELAECRQLLKKSCNEAKMYFEKAHAELSLESWYADNRTDELKRMKYLSKKN